MKCRTIANLYVFLFVILQFYKEIIILFLLRTLYNFLFFVVEDNILFLVYIDSKYSMHNRQMQKLTYSLIYVLQTRNQMIYMSFCREEKVSLALFGRFPQIFGRVFTIYFLRKPAVKSVVMERKIITLKTTLKSKITHLQK